MKKFIASNERKDRKQNREKTDTNERTCDEKEIIITRLEC